jgi:hypothetical protein
LLLQPAKNVSSSAKLRDEIKRLDSAALELPAFEKSIARASAAQNSGVYEGIPPILAWFCSQKDRF